MITHISRVKMSRLTVRQFNQDDTSARAVIRIVKSYLDIIDNHSRLVVVVIIVFVIIIISFFELFLWPFLVKANDTMGKCRTLN